MSYTGASNADEAFINLSECSGPSLAGASQNGERLGSAGGTLSRSSSRGLSPSPRSNSPLARSSSAAASTTSASVDSVVNQAKVADDRLRQYSLLSGGGDPSVPHFLPSLSVLAEASFGRLTGVPDSSVKAWADAMVLHSLETTTEIIPNSEEDIYNTKPAAMKTVTETTASVLRVMLEEKERHEDAQHLSSPSSRPRPCGYVFNRGDIAWNCRTCQADSTCVVCDNCFRDSDHKGHEVYFHRTTPGGCCDCGDPEAWKSEGCCDKHRFTVESKVESTVDDPEEAVRMSQKALKESLEGLNNGTTALPPRMVAALGVVIGAAVNCLVQSADGAGIGADPIQWKMRWADEASRLKNGAAQNDDYSFQNPVVTPNSFLSGLVPQILPNGYRLHLRLHNDDVHTFDEVIDALHEPRQSRRNTPGEDELEAPPLVPLRDTATEMTHHVDADGQVTVKSFTTIGAALQGFRRLKSRGLHCAVVGTVQVSLEKRAKSLSNWLAEISSAHPSAAALVVHALVQVKLNDNFGAVSVWRLARTIPSWAALDTKDEAQACRRRFGAFPPHLASSYVTREEAELLHEMGMNVNPNALVEFTGTNPSFFSKVPYRLQPERYRKSPHALWGTLPSLYTDPLPITSKHPLLHHLYTGEFDAGIANRLTENVHIVDTDLRKQQEADRITASVYAHKLPGLHIVSGVGTRRLTQLTAERPPLPSPMQWRHLLATSSFRAPASPCLLLMLLDPYPTKQFRSAIHALFLSLLTDARFKCRFAAALGVSYRPLSTLFCAGVGTEADTPLGFTVQIFTTGTLVRGLGSAAVAEKLLNSDCEESADSNEASIGVFTTPLAHAIVRCIHTNILGATKEVNMILNNTNAGNDRESEEDADMGNDALLRALTYVAGEHPLMSPLPAAPDDGFLDSRSTRHKRLPHLLRDLEYVIETPGTAVRLLLPEAFPVYQGPSLSFRGENVLTFPAVFARLLRVAQGMDPQKRKISGGHVEYEQNRWLEAFGLSLNFAGTRDALAESLTNSSSASSDQAIQGGSTLETTKDAMGNMLAALLREMKLWLYREGLLETGLPVPSGGAHGGMDLLQEGALQRSTLHVSGAQSASVSAVESTSSSSANVHTVALSCATGVKMTEAQLNIIESTMRIEGSQGQYHSSAHSSETPQAAMKSPVLGDWLRVPHSPLAGDSLSFHLPLHRALAKTVRSMCAIVVPESERTNNSQSWWKLSVLDEISALSGPESALGTNYHPLVPLIRPTLRSSNCRVVWSAGPDCTPQEAQRRRSRSRSVSANIAVAKIIHSLADHPIRCLAAAQQIERHLWARNGSATAGMALNYSSTPLCQRFRDLDLTLVQLSAAGLSVGLGARRVFALLISRFSMDGYLCDPERRMQSGGSSPSSAGAGYGSASGNSYWVNPPRMQDTDHAIVLSESFFATLCIIVTELPPPPPLTGKDDTWLRQSIRRELLHALVAEPRSHSEAMAAASCAVSRRDESDGSAMASGGGSLFREAFGDVLREIGKKKNQGSSRVSSGPPAFELRAECCDEYDPTFFHLRRQEHQHAMDIVSRLRKSKFVDKKESADSYCLPLVCAPPRAHPRFLPCRLLLHLQGMDAALRRSLLFALTGGTWLPPAEPKVEVDSEEGAVSSDSIAAGTAAAIASSPASGEVPVMTFGGRRVLHGAPTSSSFIKKNEGDQPEPFSPDVVAASSVSFLEVLQLLTLQVHTLEECASLHRTLPDLDDEAKLFSAGLSINSYLGRLMHVPDSLTDVWALRPHPQGPLKSSGSGANRGSILGFLIALYEHRSDHGSILESGGGQEYTQGDDGHGGARSLASSGLKWLLRFVNALVDGAPSVGTAVKSATSGVPIRASLGASPSNNDGTIWTIDERVRTNISGMLKGLPELWPAERDKNAATPKTNNDKSKEARKAAQERVLKMMKQKQAAFAATIAPTPGQESKMDEGEDEDADLCIICRCDDADGENNGPLGYLGHVQRSRVAQMRAVSEDSSRAREIGSENSLLQKYRVIGHMGCQLRETEAMDSNPLACLPRGSIVTVLKSLMIEKYDILSRRVLVRHVLKDGEQSSDDVTEGWASVQSSQGYVILSPLTSICYSNSRWGSTRPIIRQCGHAAHFNCVEAHTLSLHQRAAGEQPYDGRFAANIDDGEFLCPLCKQLSNILIPRDNFVDAVVVNTVAEVVMKDAEGGASKRKLDSDTPPSHVSLRSLLTKGARQTEFKANRLNSKGQKALKDFGGHLYQAMDVPWERNASWRRQNQQQWHPAIQRWDYEDEVDSDLDINADQKPAPKVKRILRHLRQQHIAWAAVGHSAAAQEAASRGVEEVLPFGVMSTTSDPWSDYSIKNKDNHPMLLELKRTIAGVAGLFEVLIDDAAKELGGETNRSEPSVIGTFLADIVEGTSWFQCISQPAGKEEQLVMWSLLTGLMSSIPCHVARDGQISQRSEARASASAMWIARGAGTEEKKADEPPAPLAVCRVVDAVNSIKQSSIPPEWGTLDPFAFGPENSQASAPFRPAVACSFLYTPLLAWDLNTFAGTMFSTVLVNDVADLPTSEDLMYLAQVLLVSRMIQAAVTPRGIVLPDEMDADCSETWTEPEIGKEGEALSKLMAHWREKVRSKSCSASTDISGSDADLKSSPILVAVGDAILPFSRSVILLLRACTALIRERRRLNHLDTSKLSQFDKLLDNVMLDTEIMACEDGFSIYKALKAPLPSTLMDVSSPWWARVDGWLVAVTGWELHHGSLGNNVVPMITNGTMEGFYHSTTLQDSARCSSATKSQGDGGSQFTGVEGLSVANQPESFMDDGEEEVMDIDNEAANDGEFVQYNMMGPDGEESDEELMEGVELDHQEIAVVGFPGLLAAVPAGRNTGGPGNEGPGDSSDENSSAGSDGASGRSDRAFAHVSRSPIIAYQPSLLALAGIGAVREGTFFESDLAISVMSDLSHLGLIHRRDIPTFSLARLPISFVELYSIVNKVKGRDEATLLEDTDDTGNAETAICLVSGAVLKSGSSRRSFSRSSRPPGACTLHARKNGSGIGIFFLVQKCTVLLMHNNKSAYSASLYVDEHGEEDPGLRRGRPLFLNEDRYRALEKLWRQQGIPREVAQIRSTSDRVIRDNWY